MKSHPQNITVVKELMSKDIRNPVNIYQSKAAAKSFKLKTKQLLGSVGLPQKAIAADTRRQLDGKNDGATF